MVLADAVRLRASDIHVEPQRDGLRIRYRVDGLLRDVMTVPRSALRVGRQPDQDRVRPRHRRAAACRRTAAPGSPSTASAIDARVSTLPSLHGEKVVIRLLTRAEHVPPLADVGLDAGPARRPSPARWRRRRAWC